MLFLFCQASLKQKLQQRTNCVYHEEDRRHGEQLRAWNEKKKDNKKETVFLKRLNTIFSQKSEVLSA